MKKILLLLASCLILLACAGASPTTTTGLTFIHVNDTYRVGAVEDGTAGGFGRVVTVVREAQAEGRDVRVLHGGDFLYPSLESQIWNGLQMVDVMNFVDAVAPLYLVAGNHEFDRSTPGPLEAAVRESNFSWLGDNYFFRTGDVVVDNAVHKAFTFDAADKTIGVFALTLSPADGGNLRDYVVNNGDYIGVAEAVIDVLEAEGVDMIIGLTHLHMWQDEKLAGLKARHPKLAFIVGGHEHEPQYSPATTGAAAVMKGASNARIVWRVDVDFDAAGNFSINETKLVLDESVAEDPEYQQVANVWNQRLLEKFPFLEAEVGVAAVPMDAREEYVRSHESSWGDFITDQMLTAFRDPPADLAFINSGTLRLDDVIEGDIRFEDIGRTFGFSSFLRYTTVTGEEFKNIMEAGYRGGPESQGYFPQIAGFRVCVDRSRNEFDRIVSLQVPGADGWQEIDPDTEYMLVMPDFLYNGGDGYEIPKDRFASRPGSELKYLVLNAILEAQGKGEAIGVAVTPENRRYHALREAKEPCFAQ